MRVKETWGIAPSFVPSHTPTTCGRGKQRVRYDIPHAMLKICIHFSYPLLCTPARISVTLMSGVRMHTVQSSSKLCLYLYLRVFLCVYLIRVYVSVFSHCTSWMNGLSGEGCNADSTERHSGRERPLPNKLK